MDLPEILIYLSIVVTILLLIVALLDYCILASSKVPLLWRINPMPKWKFDPSSIKNYFKETPSLIIITGGNEGIGRETALQLAKTNAHIIIAARNKDRSEQTVKEISNVTGNQNVMFVSLDLSSIKSIQVFVKEIKNHVISNEEDMKAYASGDRKKIPLYALINNAGIMLLPQKTLSEDGIEMTFAVNYFGPFILTNLLIPYLKLGSKSLKIPTRIINVSSRAHLIGPTKVLIDNLKSEKYFDRHMVYGNSKLALIMFTKELARRLDEDRLKTADGSEIRCFVLHPGTIVTNLFRHVPYIARVVVDKFFSVTPREGAMTTLYCCIDDEPLKYPNGSYYSECALAKGSSKARDSNFNKRLWEATQNICQLPNILPS